MVQACEVGCIINRWPLCRGSSWRSCRLWVGLSGHVGWPVTFYHVLAEEMQSQISAGPDVEASVKASAENRWCLHLPSCTLAARFLRLFQRNFQICATHQSHVVTRVKLSTMDPSAQSLRPGGWRRSSLSGHSFKWLTPGCFAVNLLLRDCYPLNAGF